MASSFSIKNIEIRIGLAYGSKGEQSKEKIIRGLATEVTVEKKGLPDKNSAQVKIYNLGYDSMTELTYLAFQPLQARKNTITILAGDETDNDLGIVFIGEITLAHADFNSAPDVTFNITAMSGAYPTLTSEQDFVLDGDMPVSDIVAGLATEMGYTFINEGITARLNNAVLAGSPMEKAEEAAHQVGAEILLDDDRLVLMPAKKARKSEIVLLNKNTGMIGYPSFNNDGISVNSLFNPNLEHGGLIEIESIVPQASGRWKITSLRHDLTAYKSSGGPWRSSMEAVYLGNEM